MLEFPAKFHAHQTADVARGMGALKAELAAAKRTEGSGGTPGRTSEMMSMQRQILEKLPALGSGGGGGEMASLRQQLEQSRSEAQDARSMVQQLRQQVGLQVRSLWFDVPLLFAGTHSVCSS